MTALVREIKLRKDYIKNERIETIYLGGGTPSLCTMHDIQMVMAKIADVFTVANDAEITIETNPDDITKEKLEEWKAAGINRLSIGIQSFFEEDLLWMNRVHNAAQAKSCIGLSQKAGFENITIDLIYGTPQLTDEKWRQNVETAIGFNIQHLSCYALTIEPKTPLQKQINLGTKENIDPDKQAMQFLLLMDWMEDAGYEHYEISNFAKPHYRSRHNSSYWRGEKYLGIGPSAHSFDGISRQWNISNNAVYIKSITDNKIPFEKEILTPNQRLNEYIMTSLRTVEGLDLNKIAIIEKKRIETAAQKFINSGLLIKQRNYFQLTKHGKLLADGIAADLFTD